MKSPHFIRSQKRDQDRAEFVETVAGALDGVSGPTLESAFQYWRNVDADIGHRIEQKVRAGATKQGAEGTGETGDRSLKRAG